jgi:hypothetical protein
MLPADLPFARGSHARIPTSSGSKRSQPKNAICVRRRKTRTLVFVRRDSGGFVGFLPMNVHLQELHRQSQLGETAMFQRVPKLTFEVKIGGGEPCYKSVMSRTWKKTFQESGYGEGD